MIRDFAHELEAQGCPVVLDAWPGMVHDFQGSGSLLPESREALGRPGRLLDLVRAGRSLSDLPPTSRTERRAAPPSR